MLLGISCGAKKGKWKMNKHPVIKEVRSQSSYKIRYRIS